MRETKKEQNKRFRKQSSERIKFIIDKHCKGIQQIFADTTGIDKASVSQYVRGKNAPSNDTAVMIGNAFGYNPPWVQGFDVPMKATDDNGNEKCPFDENTSAQIIKFFNNPTKSRIFDILNALDDEMLQAFKTIMEGAIKK